MYQRDSGALLLIKPVATTGIGERSMNSWIIWVVWGAFAFVAALLGFVGRHFTLRTLRYVTAVTAAAVVVLITRYGLMHPAHASANLVNSFRHGADVLSAAFFHPLLLVLPGSQIPAPGRMGWLIIAVLLVIGYRVLEAWAMRREAPVIDTSALGGSQPDGASSAKKKSRATGGRGYDELVARLKFQLSAIEVRSPAILPGGSRTDGLASIAEASGVAGGGLAGAIIQFFGMLWPKPRRFQVRVRVESGSGQPGADGTKVTVSLDEPATGRSVATKTLAAGNLDEAAAVVAGYVAQHIFIRDPTTPPWCVGLANGRDLAAMLLAKQERVHGRSSAEICRARNHQIEILEKVAGNNQCAGVVRYELAQLHDLAGNHMAALRLHAVNRQQHPRFYRGRYRLSMSLEMLANPAFPLQDTDIYMLDEILSILNRCGATRDVARQPTDIVAGMLQPELREKLLAAARNELRVIRRQLTLRHVIWGTFCHRDERLIRIPHWGLRKRQSFHDGLCVAELLVAIRQSLNEAAPADATGKLRHMNLALRLAADIASDNVSIAQRLANLTTHGTAETQCTTESGGPKFQPSEKRNRTRWLPWQRRTPSWEAAYNTACAYAALNLDHRVIISLQQAINNPDCEMQRPWDWISHDPDFSCLKSSSKNFNDFLDAQERKDYPVAIHRRANAGGMELAVGHSVSGSSPELVPAGSAVG